MEYHTHWYVSCCQWQSQGLSAHPEDQTEEENEEKSRKKLKKSSGKIRENVGEWGKI